MSRRRWLTGAATVLLLMAGTMGCKVTDFSLLFQPPLGPEDQVITGSLETVAAGVDDKLHQLGFATQFNRDGQAITITATIMPKDEATPVQTFVVTLNRRKTADGEVTQVHVDWDVRLANEFRSQVMLHLGGHKPAPPAAATTPTAAAK